MKLLIMSFPPPYATLNIKSVGSECEWTGENCTWVRSRMLCLWGGGDSYRWLIVFQSERKELLCGCFKRADLHTYQNHCWW